MFWYDNSLLNRRVSFLTSKGNSFFHCLSWKSANKFTLTFRWRNYAICLKSGVWVCELCNWEIGTIYPTSYRTPSDRSAQVPPTESRSALWLAHKRGAVAPCGRLGSVDWSTLPPLGTVAWRSATPACQTHDPVAGGACCNENTSIGGWIYQLVCLYSPSNTDQVSSFVALFKMQFATAREGGGRLKEA